MQEVTQKLSGLAIHVRPGIPSEAQEREALARTEPQIFLGRFPHDLLSAQPGGGGALDWSVTLASHLVQLDTGEVLNGDMCHHLEARYVRTTFEHQASGGLVSTSTEVTAQRRYYEIANSRHGLLRCAYMSGEEMLRDAMVGAVKIASAWTRAIAKTRQTVTLEGKIKVIVPGSLRLHAKVDEPVYDLGMRTITECLERLGFSWLEFCEPVPWLPDRVSPGHKPWQNQWSWWSEQVSANLV